MCTLQATGLFTALTAVLVHYIRSGDHLPWYTRLLGVFKPYYPFHGTVEGGFEELEKKFKENFDLGSEVGASIVVFSHGKKVVELYGGFKNFEKKIPYNSDTLQLVFSSSKNMEAIAVARLVEQGYLKYEDKIASIWPEFGALGKEDVTVEDLLRHEGGVAYFSDPQPAMKDLLDSEKRYQHLIDQPHLWEGKRVRCYHAMTRGWYLNEIVRRVHPQKRTLGEIYAKEINPLLNVEFYLGLSKENMPRRSTWYGVKKFDLLSRLFLPSFIVGSKAQGFNSQVFNKKSHFYKSNKLIREVENFENSEDIHRSENPSFNGFTSALSLAKIMACLANKGRLEDVVLISEKGFDNAISNCTEADDVGIYIRTSFSRGGFGVFTFPECGNVKFYGWPGSGGSFTFFSPEHNFSIAYVMNGAGLSLLTEGRAKGLIFSAFKAHMKLHCKKE